MKEWLEAGKLAWEFLEASRGHSLLAWVPRLLVWALIIGALLAILKWLLETLLKIANASRDLGFPLIASQEKREELRQRQNFAKVLISDLAILAKTESWNDQYFTDLEAQIEAEGDFYASNLQRLLKRPSRGRRQVRSLTRAIESSAEQFLLLIGDPGAGKSIALRHLAYQYATRTSRSNDLKAPIPLYVNLKELPNALPSELGADFIKKFILDNIRRGDSGTATYVQEHWDRYIENGTWFFLLDSFDEIPAVLHAPTGSPIISGYANAIRQFLTGMSACRAIVASREFKGPRTLPWQRFRIQPLSIKRREELIRRSLLPRQLRDTVWQHLAGDDSSIYSNPLFLTLLCRYVRDQKEPPKTDYDLLDRHINRLAEADSEFVSRKYALFPAELLSGAVTLANLFARDASLSLSPTQDEISAVITPSMVPGNSLENLLAALVYLKIGRTDVQEARSGDRRFTFAHRRYQEALVVRSLASDPASLPLEALLRDIRWREYAVTLLQSQPTEVFQPLLSVAGDLLRSFNEESQPIQILPEYGGSLHYSDWDSFAAYPLLTLLQEGLSKRTADIPHELRVEVAGLLMPRWENGDFLDREMALRVCGLLPDELLASVLEQAVTEGTEEMLELAFQKANLLTRVPDRLLWWIRSRASKEIIAATGKPGLLRIEAIGTRLPEMVGFRFILRRNCILRRIWLLRPSWILKMLRRPGTLSRSSILREGVDDVMMIYQLVIVLVLAGPDLVLSSISPILGVLGGLLILMHTIVFGTLLIFSRSGEPISLRGLRKLLRSRKFSGRSFRRLFLAMLYSLGIILPGPLIVLLVDFIRKWSLDKSYYAVAAVIGQYAILIGPEFARRRRSDAKLRELQRNEACVSTIPLHAGSSRELRRWLSKKASELLPTPAHIRSLGTLILSRRRPRPISSCPHSPQLFEISESERPWQMKTLGGALMRELRVREPRT